MPGWNFQPDARLLWNVDARQVLWIAASRANRLPSLNERNTAARAIYVPPSLAVPVPTVISTTGNPDLRPERLTALQIGYRNQVSATLSLDANAYMQQHRDLILGTGGPDCAFAAAPGGAYLSCVGSFRNGTDARAQGFDAALDWRPVETWRVHAAYSYLDMEVAGADTPGNNTILGDLRGGSPRHQAWLRLSHDLNERTQIDVAVRRVGALQTAQPVPAYTAVDARFGWKLARGLDLSLVGRNLFDPAHPEFFDQPFFIATETRRSLFARLTWQH